MTLPILVKNYHILAFLVLVGTSTEKDSVPVREMASTEREFPEYLRFPAVPHLLSSNY